MVLGRPTCHGRCTGFCVQEGKAIATDPTSQWYRKIDRMVHACAVKPGKKNLPWRKSCLSCGKDKKKNCRCKWAITACLILPYTSPAFGWKAKRLYSQ